MSTYSAFRASSGKGGETEIAYVERTTNLTISATTEAGAESVVSLPATYYDGSPITLEFFCAAADVNTVFIFVLRDGATILNRFSDSRGANASVAVNAVLRFSPTPGVHTYNVAAMKSGGSGIISAGTGLGGAGTYAPTFLRAARVSPDAGSGPARAEVQLDYVEQPTSVTVSGSTSAAPTTVLTGNPILCDGVTALSFEFFCSMVLVNGSTPNCWIGLYEDGVLVGTDGWANIHYNAGNNGTPVFAKLQRTPSAGVHTYSVRAWRDQTAEMRSTSGYGYRPMSLKITAVSPGVLGVAPLASEFKIYDSLLAAPAASFDVQNIPAIYSHLKLVLQARGTAGGLSGHYLRFNGDAGANYDYQYSQANGGVHDQAGGAAQSEMNVTGVGAAASANMFDTSELILYNYASTAMFKAMLGTTGLFYTLGTTNTYRAYRWSFLWRSLAAVNRIQIIADGTLVNLAAGSRLQIYGIL